MNTPKLWTAMYVLLVIAAAILFLAGQWGAATTVLALTVLINRATFIGALLLDISHQQRHITEELVTLRRAAVDQVTSDTRK